MEIGGKAMATKNIKADNWDGKSRVSTDLYRNRYNEIFGKKENDELKESYEQSLRNKQTRKDIVQTILSNEKKADIVKTIIERKRNEQNKK
tara:strand:- start:10 stop:282 length:273 start_codon:yes stop_codon:yes gene_type:complete